MFEGIEAKAILKHCVLYTQVAVTQGGCLQSNWEVSIW
jgi:hypothetical protein